jgi:uncharacterized membrane protein
VPEKPPNSLDIPPQEDPEPERIGVRTRFQSVSWMAPLPPPEVLAEYNEAFSGCAERIVNAADIQASHRQHLETITVEGNIRSQFRGQWMAFIIALIMLLGGFALIYLNKNILGTIFVGGDIVAVIGVFVYGKRDQRQQLRAKADTVKSHRESKRDD